MYVFDTAAFQPGVTPLYLYQWAGKLRENGEDEVANEFYDFAEDMATIHHLPIVVGAPNGE